MYVCIYIYIFYFAHQSGGGASKKESDSPTSYLKLLVRTSGVSKGFMFGFRV